MPEHDAAYYERQNYERRMLFDAVYAEGQARERARSPHMTGECGIDQAHSVEDHVAYDRIMALTDPDHEVIMHRDMYSNQTSLRCRCGWKAIVTGDFDKVKAERDAHLEGRH